MLLRSGIHLVKYWFSVSDAAQEKRDAQARLQAEAATAQSMARPLVRACRARNRAEALRLIAAGADIECLDNEEKRPGDAILERSGYTPLAISLFFSTFDEVVAKALIDRGANVNFADNTGHSVLQLAVVSASPALVKLMLQRGAQVNDAADQGQSREDTPLDRALERNRPDVAAVLRAHGGKTRSEVRQEAGGCKNQ